MKPVWLAAMQAQLAQTLPTNEDLEIESGQMNQQKGRFKGKHEGNSVAIVVHRHYRKIQSNKKK